MPLFADKTASTIGDLVLALRDIMAPGSTRWFRGHANHTWKLLPSLARPPNRADAELALIKRFKQNAYSIMTTTERPEDEWAWLFLMQHHGAPTRLLDWSENPLVALYFVVSEDEHMGVDGEVVCLDPVGLNKSARVQPTATGELPFFGVDEELKAYSTESIDRAGRAAKPTMRSGISFPSGSAPSTSPPARRRSCGTASFSRPCKRSPPAWMRSHRSAWSSSTRRTISVQRPSSR